MLFDLECSPSFVEHCSPFLKGSSIENAVGVLWSVSFAELDVDENVVTKLIQLQSVFDFAFLERVLPKTTTGIMFSLVSTFHQVYWLSVDVQCISIIFIHAALFWIELYVRFWEWDTFVFKALRSVWQSAFPFSYLPMHHSIAFATWVWKSSSFFFLTVF